MPGSHVHKAATDCLTAAPGHPWAWGLGPCMHQLRADQGQRLPGGVHLPLLALRRPSCTQLQLAGSSPLHRPTPSKSQCVRRAPSSPAHKELPGYACADWPRREGPTWAVLDHLLSRSGHQINAPARPLQGKSRNRGRHVLRDMQCSWDPLAYRECTCGFFAVKNN